MTTTQVDLLKNKVSGFFEAKKTLTSLLAIWLTSPLLIACNGSGGTATNNTAAAAQVATTTAINLASTDQSGEFALFNPGWGQAAQAMDYVQNSDGSIKYMAVGLPDGKIEYYNSIAPSNKWQEISSDTDYGNANVVSIGLNSNGIPAVVVVGYAGGEVISWNIQNHTKGILHDAGWNSPVIR